MTFLLNIANIARETRDYAKARQLYQEVVLLAGKVRYQWGEGQARLELGDVLRGQGEYRLALEQMQRAWQLFQQIGSTERAAVALAWLGLTHFLLGNGNQAQQLLTESLQLSQGQSIKEAQTDSHYTLALIALNHGNLAEALIQAQHSLYFARESQQQFKQAAALILMGHAQRPLAQVQVHYMDALAICEQIGEATAAAEAKAGLAQLALADGDLPAAQQWVAAILPLLAEQQLVGVDEPFFCYRVCYEVLAARHDARAEAILQQGQQRLQAFVRQNADVDTAAAFVQHLAARRALKALAARVNQPG